MEPDAVLLAYFGKGLDRVVGAEDGGACSGIKVERGISLIYRFVD